ncbi:PfkB family carbohydrate kinase [Mesorhizobium sp. ZMM04-5]|uniref:PfkB family carbohydrate kinase n=1 Tax=Mesorhizobium marinum TaxID=3228790 RepID=A0ABV3QXP3_9HYPH
MRRATLLSVGALTLDTILKVDTLPREQGKFVASGGMTIASGMAASAACAAQRLGADAWLWASAGDDAAGEQLISGIAADGVNCSLVRRVAGGRSAISAVIIDDAGERVIVPYYDPVTQADPVALPMDIGRFDAVLADVRWPGAAALALTGARDAGRAAILDADTAPREVLERLIPMATHVVASEQAARILCGALPPQAACAAIAGRAGVFVAVTAGAAGTWWRDKGSDMVRHVAAPRVTAIDTLAAGDVFHGGFAVGLAEGMQPEAALRLASAAAAIKCTRFGGRLGAPGRAETLALVEETWGTAG